MLRTSSDYAIAQPAATPEIEAARQKFFTDPEAPKSLTLEEIMLIYYNKPCRRIHPDSPEAKRYARGSVLVMETEIILVLLPEDDTTGFKRKSMRIAGAPMRRYDGLLPGSRIYTKGGVFVTIETPVIASELRMFFGFAQLMNQNAEAKNVRPRIKSEGFRCKESWVLECCLDPRRIHAAIPGLKKYQKQTN